MPPVWIFFFYFIKSPLPAPTPPPQHATSNNTAKLHWIPTLLFLILYETRRARIFDTTLFYIDYSCRNENNTRLVILEELLRICVQVERI